MSKKKKQKIATDLDPSVISVLEETKIGLLDWLQTFASEVCNEEDVKKSWHRINAAGGTLAYIARMRARIQIILDEDQNNR